MRHPRKGFTLVELLVVMAIIAILAAIVVPNVTSYIRRARAVRALGDIKGMELALTKMLTDANANHLSNMFDPNKIKVILYGEQDDDYVYPPLTKEQFDSAANIYTRTTYALLREGRIALSDAADPEVGAYAQYLNESLVKKLGTTYLEDIGFDPWGNLYQIFPGPWPANRITPQPDQNEKIGNLNIFRIYMPNTGAGDKQLPGQKAAGGRPDALTINYEFGADPANVAEVQDPDTELYEVYGFSAPNDQMAFIYSWGQNMVSGQAMYAPVYAADGRTPYNAMSGYGGDDPLTWGGGDDINNWDNDQSWMRFYN